MDPWVVSTITEGHSWSFIESSRNGFPLHEVSEGGRGAPGLPGLCGKTACTGSYRSCSNGREKAGCVFPPVFCIRKKNGDLCPVIDLCTLNQCICRERFKKDSLQSILAKIRLGDLTVSIDLKDATFHMPLHVAYHQYLRFCLDGRHFQFGLSAVRAVHFSENILEGVGDSDRPSSHPGDLHLSLSGQHPGRSPLKETVGNPPRQGADHALPVRMANQHQKECSVSNPGIDIPGSDGRQLQGHGITASRKGHST